MMIIEMVSGVTQVECWADPSLVCPGGGSPGAGNLATSPFVFAAALMVVPPFVTDTGRIAALSGSHTDLRMLIERHRPLLPDRHDQTVPDGAGAFKIYVAERHRAAPSGPVRHRPAPSGTVRHRPAPCGTVRHRL
jgi:hypothetical protein